jgi:hypothetical protein
MTRHQDNRCQDDHHVNPMEWQTYEVHDPMSPVLGDFDGPDLLRDFGIQEYQMFLHIFPLKNSIPEVTNQAPRVSCDRWL